MRQPSIGRMIALAILGTVASFLAVDTTMACRLLFRFRHCDPCPPLVVCPAPQPLVDCHACVVNECVVEPACCGTLDESTSYSLAEPAGCCGATGGPIVEPSAPLIEAPQPLESSPLTKTVPDTPDASTAAPPKTEPTPAEPPKTEPTPAAPETEEPAEATADDLPAETPGDDLPADDIPADDAPAIDEPAEVAPADEPAADAPADDELDDAFAEPADAAADAPADAPVDAPADDVPAAEDTDLPGFDEPAADAPADGAADAPADAPADPPAGDAAPADEPAADEAPADGEKSDELDDLFGGQTKAIEPAHREQPTATAPVAAPPVTFEFRMWTDNTGQFQTVGKLVKLTPTHVRLLKDTGKYTTVPRDRLSEEDVRYLNDVIQRLGSETLDQVASR